MSARILSQRAWRLALPVAGGALLAGMPAGIALAQQPAAANAGAATHAAPSGENKGGRPQEPQVKFAPAKERSIERSIIHGGPNVVDHNAIGISVVRPDGGQRPAAPNLGRAAAPVAPIAPVPPTPPGGAAGLAGRALEAPHVSAPAPRPLVLSRGTINGASFTRPGTALKPLGGPAKPAATGINGTTFRPKP
jgi:hypothetical protein